MALTAAKRRMMCVGYVVPNAATASGSYEPSDVQESGRPVRDRKPPDAYDPGSIAQPDGKWREGPSSTVTGPPGTVSQRLSETSRFEEEHWDC